MSLKNRLSKETVNERLASQKRDVRLVGQYVNKRTKTEFECSLGHRWIVSPGSVTRNEGTGCPVCVREATKLTKKSVNDKIRNRGIQLVGDYVANKIKTEFVCENSHYWIATPNHVMRGTGCPSCIATGFDPNKPGWEYAFTRDGYLKFGITNDLARRINEHRKYGEINLVHERYHEVGQLALDWENHIKRTHGGRYVTKEQCPDGYTETLSVSKLNEIINDQKSTKEQSETI